MELNSAKVLDEACNRYNDAYRDEALYATWLEAPYGGEAAASAEYPAAASTGPGRVFFYSGGRFGRE